MNPQVQELEKVRKPAAALSSLLEANRDSSLEFENIPVKGYERVLKVVDKKNHLTAIIALHDTTLGPALGGIRIYPYNTFNDALEDVLRLSKGMTYKAAVSEVGCGGGKSVILADPMTEKTPDMLLAFGEAVERLGGAYICAEDVGCTTEDCRIIRSATKYVVGLPHVKSSGDPGPFTAWGVFRGVQSVAKHLFKSDSLEGKRVAVQGLGAVGSSLVNYLFWAGAELILSDIDRNKAEKIAAKVGAKTVSPDAILAVECDIVAPCALGGIINDQTIPQFRCKAIAGGANNQLLRDHHAEMLKNRGILYAPDFVINAGGLINVAAEIEETGYHPCQARSKIHRIYDCLLAIYEIADRNRDSTHAAATALADYRIKYGIGKRAVPPTYHSAPDW